MGHWMIYLVVQLIGLLALAHGGRRKGPREYCAIFPKHYTEVLRDSQASFIELGDMGVDENFSIEMMVKPMPTDHDGNLFAIGSKREFPYYEWRTKANSTQYLVVEIVYSSVLLTLKALGTYNLHSIEIYRTYPEPYNIADGEWHTIKAWRSPGYWHLKMDEIEVMEKVKGVPDEEHASLQDDTKRQKESTDVRLHGMPAFLGGRPGYIDLQFRGMIKNLTVNGQKVPLRSNAQGKGDFHVVKCESRAARNFTNLMETERSNAKRKPEWMTEESHNPDLQLYMDSSDDNLSDDDDDSPFFDHEDPHMGNNQQFGIGGVY